MMKKEYIRKIFPLILDFSISLDKTSSILDKPWVRVGTDIDREKYIFKKNHELLISLQGKVEICHWEFLDEANSFLIKREGGTFLYNQGFLDKAVLILKIDGIEEYLTLANQNLLPDLDVKGYLDKLRYRKYNIQKIPLADGSFLEVERQYNTSFPATGDRVTREGKGVADGKYYLKNDDQLIVVTNNRIRKILHLKIYDYNKRSIEIEQQDEEDISEGDIVKINGRVPSDGLYLISQQKFLSIQQGQVVSVGFRKHIRRWIFIGAFLVIIILAILYIFLYQL